MEGWSVLELPLRLAVGGAVMNRAKEKLFCSALLLFTCVMGCSGDQHGDETTHDEHPTHEAGQATVHGTDRVGDPDDWCGGCGVPESMCTRCHPELIERFQAAGDYCDAHGFPESVCPQCHPMQAPVGPRPHSPPLGEKSIRFRSSSIESAAGIETVAARRDSLGIELESTARIEFDRNRMADICAPIPGVIREIAVDLGEDVSAADVLFVLESSRVGDLQARRQAARERLETARTNLDRQVRLREGGISSQRQIELARRELESAQAELRSIDGSLRLSGAPRVGRAGRFSVRSPLAGEVVRRSALLGSFAAESDSLATVADTSNMWVLVDVSEWDASVLEIGQTVEVRVDGITGRTFTGRVTWIASEVDPRTRTVTVRAELENHDGALRAGQFAHATIRLATPESAVTVPIESVQRVDGESVLFVRRRDGLFEARPVALGRSDGHRVQVTGEVQVGERVVTTGAFLLRTELAREDIGAGCCEVGGRGEG